MRCKTLLRALLPTLLVFLSLLALGPGCGGPDDGLVIYTSVYPQVIERMKPGLAAAFPDVEIEWRQAGSEQLARKLSVELEAGATRCDLLMTSDPFFYAQLAEAGHLATYETAATAGVPARLQDAGRRWATVRIPVMVIGVNHERVSLADHPTSFQDLLDPRYRDQIAMGDPLKSGTSFTTVAALVRKYGWPYFEGLAANGMQSAGGNSTVTNKLETGERPIGIVLLENLLPRIAQGAPITVVYPSDGAIPIPSPIAILKNSDKPALARRVYDYLFSRAMQDEIVAGFMYSPLPGGAAPVGARPLSEISLFPWDGTFMAWAAGERDALKQRFGQVLRRP